VNKCEEYCQLAGGEGILCRHAHSLFYFFFIFLLNRTLRYTACEEKRPHLSVEDYKDDADVTANGILFQSCRPASGKARLATVERCTGGVVVEQGDRSQPCVYFGEQVHT